MIDNPEASNPASPQRTLLRGSNGLLRKYFGCGSAPQNVLTNRVRYAVVFKNFTTNDGLVHFTALLCAMTALGFAVCAGKKWADAVYASFGVSRGRAAIGAAVIAAVASIFMFVMLENAAELFGPSTAADVARGYSPVVIVLGALLGIVCFLVQPVRNRLTLALLGWAITAAAATLLGTALGGVFDLVKPRQTGGHVIGPFPWWFDIGLMAGIYGAVAGLAVALWLGTRRRA
jgi:hypothetical protein